MSPPQNALADLMEIATGYQRSRALMVAAELGIADQLRDGLEEKPERSFAEWRSLFETSGFRLESVKRATPNSYALVGAPE